MVAPTLEGVKVTKAKLLIASICGVILGSAVGTAVLAEGPRIL